MAAGNYSMVKSVEGDVPPPKRGLLLHTPASAAAYGSNSWASRGAGYRSKGAGFHSRIPIR